MDVGEFGKLFRSFHRAAFRLETLPQYLVPDEAERFDQYLKGVPLPSDPNTRWTDLVRTATSAGKLIHRVHMINQPLTPYLRFEIDWGYLYNAAAGERIYLLDNAQAPELAKLQPQDFWAFDDSIFVRMLYSPQGEFLGVSNVTDDAELDRLRRLRDVALAQATPLHKYLAGVRAAGQSERDSE